MDWDLSLTYGIIIVWSFYQILRDKRFFSAKLVFYFFSSFFLGVAPLIQYWNDAVIAPMYSTLQEEDFLRANIIILLVFLSFEILYPYFYKKSFTKMFSDSDRQSGTDSDSVEDLIEVKTEKQDSESETKLIPRLSVICVLVLISVFYKAWQSSFNLSNILFRGGSGEVERADISQTYALLFGTMRYFPAAAFYFYYISCKRVWYITAILFASVLFCAFPTSLARLNLAPIYLPMCYICFSYFKKHKNLLILVCVSFMVIVFPFLSFLRLDIASTDFSSYEISFFDKFCTLDYDSYKTLVFVVANDICTQGRQILGSFFFWIPRSVWNDKPCGSGYFIANEYDLGIGGDFANISMNFFGEGYINFGYAGIILFTFLLIFFCARWDRYFWITCKGSTTKIFAVYYFVILGFFPIFLRGDLLSSTAYFISALIAFLMVEKLAFKEQEEMDGTDETSSN